MQSAILRKKYIDFFVSRGHKAIPSASLVPENDPTTLFTSSGMQPLIPYLLGEKHPSGVRLVNSQKSFRAQDIEEVGDNRHTTFFEMLGNWSLGDYFKNEQLPWIFEFLTHEVGLDPKRLYVSVFEGNDQVPKDTESIELWKELFTGVHIEAHVGKRIFEYPARKNWWSRSGEPEKMPAGEPGGPDSEVFFDFGEHLGLHEKSAWKNEKCHPNCDCGRFLEIANSVFMQFQKQSDGSLKELAQKNVDFGGGLERQLAASNDNPDVFESDLFSEILAEVEKNSNKKYGDNKVAMRVIADHLKAATFLMVDGVVPSNKDRGYVLRRLLRRAAVKMHSLKGGLTPVPGFQSICASVLRTYEGVYFDFSRDQGLVDSLVDQEMSKFGRSLDKGLKEVQKISRIDGKLAFDLYQTYGFPLEITGELFSQKGQTINNDEFKKEFERHQELSRTASKGMFKGGLQDHSEQVTRLHTATHLLHQALRAVLGTHVSQKGSNITAERLRFDFAHPQKLTQEEITKIENMVNEQIASKLEVSHETTTYEEAIKAGALAFFGERYPAQVKVYSIGNFSKEICGGPHVANTSQVGTFRIIKEESASSGTRRVYATV